MAESEVKYQFFLIPVKKLVIMNICTLGLYDIFWLYKNWSAVKEAEQSNIKPFWRGLFGIFFIRHLLQKMNVENQVLIATGIVALWFSGRLPDPFWLVSFLSFLPLVVVQKQINERSSAEVSAAYSVKAKVTIAVGSVAAILVIISAFLPSPQ